MIPLGRRWKSYSLSPTTTVCPALLPPCESRKRFFRIFQNKTFLSSHTWQRATMSISPASKSTTFPLPSSPHWAPRTTVTLLRIWLASWSRGRFTARVTSTSSLLLCPFFFSPAPFSNDASLIFLPTEHREKNGWCNQSTWVPYSLLRAVCKRP